MALPSASGVSLFSPAKRSGIFFSPSGRNTPSNSSFVALRNVSLQLAGGSFTFLLRRCGKGRRPSRFFWLRAHSSGRFSEGDADAKIETPFLRFRGRLGFGRRHASDRLPPLASSSASSGRRSSRRSGQTRSRFGRSRRTSRSRFRRASWAWLRRTSRSPLTENF